MCQLTELSTVKMVMSKEKEMTITTTAATIRFLTNVRKSKVRLQNIQDQHKAAEVKVNEADE